MQEWEVAWVAANNGDEALFTVEDGDCTGIDHWRVESLFGLCVEENGCNGPGGMTCLDPAHCQPQPAYNYNLRLSALGQSSSQAIVVMKRLDVPGKDWQYGVFLDGSAYTLGRVKIHAYHAQDALLDTYTVNIISMFCPPFFSGCGGN